MRKLLVILLMGIFLISFASSFEFDNVKSFDKDKGNYGKYEISNSFLGLGWFKLDKVVDLELNYNTLKCGISCEAQKTITLYEERSLIDEVRFYRGSDEVNIRSYKLEYLNDGKYKPFKEGDIFPEGSYEVRLSGKKKLDMTVDWQIKSGGHWTTEWAVWSGDDFSDVPPTPAYYYSFNDPVGFDGTTIIDNAENINATLTGGSLGFEAHILDGWNRSTAAGTGIDLGSNFLNTDTNFTISFWFKMDTNCNANEVIWWAGDRDFKFFCDTDETIKFGYFDGLAREVTSTNALDPDRFYHIVGVRNKDVGLELFIDGQQNATAVQIGNGDSRSTSQSIAYRDDGDSNGVAGTIDEFVAYERALNITEIVELFQVSVGVVTLDHPINQQGFTSPVIDFNATVKVSGGPEIVNRTLFVWYSNGTLFGTNTTLGLSGTTESENDTIGGLVEGSFLWNKQYCDNESDCGFSINNFTFSIDNTGPVVNLSIPRGLVLEYNFANGLQAINWSITDELSLVDTCLFDFNNVNTTVTCSDNGTFITLPSTGPDFNLTFYANDSASNLGINFTEWNYSAFEFNRTFSNETIQGSSESFILTLSAGQPLSLAELIYNETVNVMNIDSSATPNVVVSGNIIIPSVEADVNVTFFWNLTFADSSRISTLSDNQTIKNLGIDDCSVFTTVIFNYTMKDEESQTILDGVTDNTSIEIDLGLFSSDRTISIANFSNDYDEINPAAVCFNVELTGAASYELDSTVKYSSLDRQIEYHNIRNFTLTNSTPIQNISLFDLLSVDATEFQITFKDSEFIVVEGALIQVNRQYVSEGVFKTVEIPITDSNGQTVANLVEKNVVYNFIVTKNRTILGTFNNKQPFCDDSTIGSCFITLNAVEGQLKIFDFDAELEIEGSFEFNKTSGDLQFDFIVTDGSSKNVTLNAIQMDQIGNNTVCFESLVSSSGSIICSVPASLGNSTLIVTILVDGKDKILTFITTGQGIDLGDAGFFLMMFMVMSIALLFIESKTMTIAGVMLGFIASSLFFFIEGGILGVGSAIVWLVIMGTILIWKLNTEGQS